MGYEIVARFCACTNSSAVQTIVLQQQPEEKSMNLQRTKNKLPNTAQITNSEKEHKKQRLTRFGLDAYVLGVMKESSY